MLWTLTTPLVVTANINGNRPVTCGIPSACFGAHSLPRHTVGQINPTSQHLSHHPPNHRQQSSENEPHSHPVQLQLLRPRLPGGQVHRPLPCLSDALQGN